LGAYLRAGKKEKENKKKKMSNITCSSKKYTTQMRELVGQHFE
jgi:hypothetical protein